MSHEAATLAEVLEALRRIADARASEDGYSSAQAVVRFQRIAQEALARAQAL